MPHPDTSAPALERALVTSEQLLGTANQSLLKALEYLESAETFVGTQVPLLIQETLLYEKVSETLNVTFGLALLYWCYRGFKISYGKAQELMERADDHHTALKKARREEGKNDYDTVDVIFTFGHYARPISAVIAGLVGTLFMLIHTYHLIKVFVAPRAFLLEHFRALLG